MSAVISSSSSASMVSTSIGRERALGRIGGPTMSSNRSTSCCVVRERPCESCRKSPWVLIYVQSHRYRLCFARWGRSISASTAARTSLRPASTSAISRRSAARRRNARRAPAPRRSSARPPRPSSCPPGLRQRPAARQLDADVAVAAESAGAGEHEIAEAGEPGERSRRPPRRTPGA